MMNQIKVENYKFARSLFFWLALVFMIAVGFFNGYKWDVTAHELSLIKPIEQAISDMSFVFMPALFTAWFIGNSFSTRTIQHEITTGASRFSVILSRAVPVFFASVLLHVSYIASTVISLGLRIGFSTFSLTTDHAVWFLTVILQILALECFFIFVNFLCCNLYVGLIVSVIATFTLVNVFRNLFSEETWYKYSFFHFFENADRSGLITCAMVALASIIVLASMTYVAFRKREI